MNPTGPATAILPVDLGTASAYDKKIFPLAYYEAEGNFDKGVVLIRSTLDEMAGIGGLGIDLNENGDFIFNTRLQLEELEEQKEKLQNKTFNPLKAILNYRKVRLFHAAAKRTYTQTKRTSEAIRGRPWLNPRVVLNTQVRAVDGAHLPPDVVIGGIAIDLPSGYDDAARRTIDDAMDAIATDPFQDDSHIPQLGEDEHAMSLISEGILSRDKGGPDVLGENRTPVSPSDLQRSRPTSPIQNHYHFYNSIVATNSNLTAPTVNQGPGLSGASVTQFTS